MGFVRPAIAAGCAVLVISIAAVAALDDADEPQRVRSAAPTGATTPPSTAAPPGSPVAGLSPAELKAVVEGSGRAEAGASVTLSIERATVPTVAGDSGRSAGRSVTLIRIPGSHPVRALGATVAIDGADVGPGLLGPDGMVAVLTDPSLARPGAVVTYRYGDGAPTTAGTLPVGR